MHEAQLLQLIREVYDAALDRTLWPSVLESTCRYVGGACAAMIAQDPSYNAGCFYYSWGLDPEGERLYLDKYIRLNPTNFAVMATMQVGDVASTCTVIQYDEFLASRFYQEWAQPRGYCDSMWTLLEKSATAGAAVAVLRDQRHGMADDEGRRRLGLLSPHFRRAVAIGKAIDLHKQEGASLADTLDGLAHAVFLVDSTGRLVHANAAGRATLTAGAVLRRVGDRLAAVDPKADRALQEVFAAADEGDENLGLKGIAIPLDAGGEESHIAHVLPLISGVRRKAGACYAATAALFVRKATLDLASPVETISRRYDLTPAELRVLFAIIEVGSVPEVTAVLGISETTVKTHLQRIFGKVGVKRQSDLVKLVAGYMSPLAPAGAFSK